jgi:uncharacterized membrane protein YcaP (DUF421 family)
MSSLLNEWLGLHVEPKDLTLLQIALRGVIVFIAALVMLRLADRRFLAKLSAFDAILGFILASVLARAINGSAAFFPTLGVSLLLVGLHRLLGRLAFISTIFEKLIKGKAQVLVRDGKRMGPTMRRYKISEADLLEEVRLHGKVQNLDEVQTATLERNGQVSVIPRE